MKYTDAWDLNEKVGRIIDALGMNHINKSRVHCIRSRGSSTRCVIARCHTLSKVLQHSMRLEPFYVIEALSERFDKMSEEEQMKTLIHELCLPYEEPIVVKTDSGLEIKSIGEFVEQEFSRAKTLNQLGVLEWIRPYKSFKVISYNIEKKRVELSNVTKLIRIPNTSKKLLSVITKDGRRIEVTPEHPILYTKNADSYDHPGRTAKIRICQAAELARLKGIPRLLTLFKLNNLDKLATEIDISDHFKHFSSLSKVSGRGKVLIENSKIKRFWVKGLPLPAKFKLDKKLGQFFGLYLSEGSIDHGSGAVSFSFHSRETKYQELVKNVLRERFNLEPKERTPHGKCKIIYVNSRLLQVLIKDVFGFGEKARHKKIPSFAHFAPIEFVAGLIDGWFAGDGTAFFNQNNAITLSAFSKSQRLIFGMLLLLARLGIVARLRREMQDILIQSFFVPKFYRYCKLLIESKDLQQKVLLIRRMKHENRFKCVKYIKLRSIKQRRHVSAYVYNLEVEPNNNFLHASGLFTHNCHIPKTFGGGFRHHDFVTRKNVETLYRKFFEK